MGKESPALPRLRDRGVYCGLIRLASHTVYGIEEDVTYALTLCRGPPVLRIHLLVRITWLWSETHLWGPHPLRKWERKARLSLDYGIEAVYCGLIRLASHAVYGIEEDVTYALIEHAPEALVSTLPPVRRVNQSGPDWFIVAMPRYQKFTDAARQVLRGQARFQEIAGNSQIMVTAVVPRDWSFQLPAGELLFSSEVLTDPRSKRVALRVPVADHSVLELLGGVTDRLATEHVYDY